MRRWIGLGWWLLLVTWAGAEVVLHLGTCGRQGGWAQSWGQRLADSFRGGSIRLRLALPRSDLEQLRALDAGELQLAWVRSSALSNWYRPWGVLTLPYLLEHPDQWLQGLAGQRLLQTVPGERLRPLLTCCLGPRWLASRNPLRQWSDLKGKVVLVPQSRFSWEQYHSLGADPWPGPLERSNEFRSRGGIEVVEACRLDLESEGWLADFPELWNPGHSQEWLVLVAEERAWTRLQPEQQGQVLKAARASQRPQKADSSPGPGQGYSNEFSGMRRRMIRLLDESWRVSLP